MSMVSFLTILVLFCIICHPFLLTAQGSSNNQSLTRPSLAEVGTRFEAVGQFLVYHLWIILDANLEG
jgi:hypothetical protein